MGLSCRYGLVNILAEEHGNCSGAGNKGGQQRGSGSHLLQEKHRLAPPPSGAALRRFYYYLYNVIVAQVQTRICFGGRG